MPGVQHQGHSQRLQRVEGSQQQVDSHKFHGTGENGHTHEHGIPEGEAGNVHVNAVGHPQKGKPGKNRDGIGKGRLQGGQVLVFCDTGKSSGKNEFADSIAEKGRKCKSQKGKIGFQCFFTACSAYVLRQQGRKSIFTLYNDRF